MDSNNENNFLDTINILRSKEEVLVYSEMLSISTEQETAVVDYLQREYENEGLEYPFTPPPFDAKAALWASKTVYFSAQLLLNRKNLPGTASSYVMGYDYELTAGAILSTDICLRFLPAILRELKLIDLEDPLISVLQSHLQQWHFSGVGYLTELDDIDYTIPLENDCIKQLYVDRIIERKARNYIDGSPLGEFVLGSMGEYTSEYWQEL